VESSRGRVQLERDQGAISVVAGRRKPVRIDLVLAWVLTVVLLPVAVWLVVAAVNDHGNYTAYKQAGACSADGSGTDCLRGITASVVASQDKGGDYSLTLEGPGIAAGQVALPSSCDGAGALYDAQQVQVQLWRGGLTKISGGGITCDLADSPSRAYAKTLGALLLVDPLYILILLLCVSSVVRMRFGPGPARRIRRAALGFLVVVLLCAGAGAGLDGTGQADAFAVYLGDGIVVAAFAIAGLIILIRSRVRARRLRAH
jgi:hypothetical protein